MHRTKVRVVEDALDANNTIARANREDFDRHHVAVLNLMSAPGAGKTSLLERALSEPLDGVRAGVLEFRSCGLELIPQSSELCIELRPPCGGRLGNGRGSLFMLAKRRCRALKRVEAQSGHALSGVLAMALEAVFGEDRTHVAAVVESEGGEGQRCPD